jgi:hypothetical protein
MIGGFVIQGDAPQTVVILAKGPSLEPYGIPNYVADPSLTLVHDNVAIAANDDWGSASNSREIQDSGFAPGNPKESAIMMTLAPGAYTAIFSGANGTQGIGLLEIYKATGSGR